MLNDIFVYDTNSDAVHRVGDNQHDSLIVIDGVVEYENLQNGCGTLTNGKGTYVFVDSANGCLCPSCLYDTGDFVCKKECGGCNGQSHFKLKKSIVELPDNYPDTNADKIGYIKGGNNGN